MAVTLRNYQRVFLDAIWAAFEFFRVVLGVLPTGGGKTMCFSVAINEHGGNSAAVVHRKELVSQISRALATLHIYHRIIAPDDVVAMIRRQHLKRFGKSYVDQSAGRGVISVQTLTSKASDKNTKLQAWLKSVTLAVFDEGHHYVEKGTWSKAVHTFDRARLLMVTATPERADGTGLGEGHGGFAQTIVEGPSTRQLIDWGYLCPYIYKAPHSTLDAEGIPLTADGDLNMRAMRQRVVESDLVGEVVEHYRTFAHGKRAIVFATDVATGEEMERDFKAAGYRAKLVHGNTERTERERAIEDFEENRTQVLINVDLFDEGFDVAGADAVILARPTESLGKYLQMVGRVLRVVYADGFDLRTVEGRKAAIAASAKPHAIVIDMVRNWERHCSPTAARKWTLQGRTKEERLSDRERLIPQRVCLECTQPYEKVLDACPFCGAEAPPPAERSGPEKVDGCLYDLDIEALEAIFAAQRAAEMTDEEYALDQARRFIPSIGRAQDMRRHRAGKARRAVLREIVGWWVAAQRGRSMSEIHKRFYHRFGVDIGTAFTLKAKETDQLIETITQRFNEDLAA